MNDLFFSDFQKIAIYGPNFQMNCFSHFHKKLAYFLFLDFSAKFPNDHFSHLQ